MDQQEEHRGQGQDQLFLLDVPAFVEEVRRRPTIWDSESGRDQLQYKVAWRQICVLNWPSFQDWPADQKRTRCLELQKRWKDLEHSFTEHYLKGDGKDKHVLYDKLAFLIPSIIAKQNKEGRASSSGEVRPAKRRKVSEETSSDGEEDRHFLLSLVSWMKDVPRSNKLALRAEMLQLISKYTSNSPCATTTTTDSPQY